MGDPKRSDAASSPFPMVLAALALAAAVWYAMSSSPATSSDVAALVAAVQAAVAARAGESDKAPLRVAVGCNVNMDVVLPASDAFVGPATGAASPALVSSTEDLSTLIYNAVQTGGAIERPMTPGVADSLAEKRTGAWRDAAGV